MRREGITDMFYVKKFIGTVIDKKLYPGLQEQYCRNPKADAFRHMGLGTLKQTVSMKKGHGGRNFLPPLLRGLGRCFPLYLCGSPGRFHYAGMDEG